MLTKVLVQNFKLHKSTEIDATPITIFIGPNNSGKSSIFQALLCLHQATLSGGNQILQTFERKYEPPYVYPQQTCFINLGEFNNLIRDGEDHIKINVAGEVRLPLKSSSKAYVEFGGICQNNSFIFVKGLINNGKYEVRWDYGPEGGHATPSTLQVDGFNVKGIEANISSPFQLRYAGLESPANSSPDRIIEIRQFCDALFFSPAQLIQSIYPIHPFRGFEEGAYPLPDYAARSLDMAILADRAVALTSILAYNEALRDKLSEWLKETLGIDLKVSLRPGKKVLIQTKAGNTIFINEGSGVQQLPFILLPIGLRSPNDTLLISEPEAHLHPKAQSSLVSLLLKIFKKENKQFFIETHSEHILHAFLFALAKKELNTNQLSIYYFENVDGTAQVRRLKLDEKGRVEGGLPGFFDHSLHELSEYLDALKSE